MSPSGIQPAAGSLRHRVRLENPHTPVSDLDGGFTDTPTVALVPSIVYAAIEPADPQNAERAAAGTVVSDVSYRVTMRYHAGVTTKTRIRFGTRILQVTGVINTDERNLTTVALCTELVP